MENSRKNTRNTKPKQTGSEKNNEKDSGSGMSKPRKGVPFDDSNSSDKKQPSSMASLNGLPDFGKPAMNRGFQGFDDGDNENSKKRGQKK